MAKVSRFEDLICWQKAHELENLVYKLTQKGTFVNDFGLKDQINRATGSAMDNIAEGFGRGSNKEFINFLIIARASAVEVQSQSYRAFDRKHIDKIEFELIYQKAYEVIGLVTNFINYLKENINRTYRKN